jgi:hypothetical protein
MIRFTRMKRNAIRSQRRARKTRRDIILLMRAIVSHPLTKVSLKVREKVNMIIKQRKIKRLKNKNKTKFNNHRLFHSSNKPLNNETNKINQV